MEDSEYSFDTEKGLFMNIHEDHFVNIHESHYASLRILINQDCYCHATVFLTLYIITIATTFDYHRNDVSF